MPVERSVGFEDAQYHLIAFQRNDLSRWALQRVDVTQCLGRVAADRR
jgi:hypothetical protein